MNKTDPWLEFLKWEGASRDTIDFKTIYVDMADDLVAGLLLSQIVYWYLPSKRGQSKLRVFKNGYYWIAKARHEWWDEIRVKPRQIDRAVAILEKKGIIITHLYRFNNAPTTHIRIDKDGFLNAWDVALARFNETVKSEPSSDPFSPNLQFDLTDSSDAIDESVKSDLPKSAKTLTETTIDFSETTAENTDDFSPKIKNADPLFFEKERETLAKREEAGNYAVPAPAGGANSFADGPVDAFWTVLAGGPTGQMPENRRKPWGIKLQEIAKDWSTEEVKITAQVMEAAICEAPETDIGWKTYKTPFQDSFTEDIGPLLLSMATKVASDAEIRRARDAERTQASLAALDARRAARAPPPADDEVGRQVKAVLEAQTARHLFRRYVAPSRFACDDGALVVAAPDAEARAWLEGNLGRIVERALAGVDGGSGDVAFEVDE